MIMKRIIVLLLFAVSAFAQTKAPPKAGQSGDRAGGGPAARTAIAKKGGLKPVAQGGLKLKVGISGVTLSWMNSVTGSLVVVNKALCTGTFTPNSGTPNAGTCSQAGGFSVVTTTAVNATSFTDTNISVGQAYVYNVQATCTGSTAACPSPYTGAGIGAASNSVAASIPSVTPPPPVLSPPTVAINKLLNGNDRLVASWTDSPNSTTAFVLFGSVGQVLRQGNMIRSSGMFQVTSQFTPQNGVVAVCDNISCTSAQFSGVL
jgi:hypothetical protein